MVSITSSVSQLRKVFTKEPELFRTILNASSPIEVSLALDILHETTPERALVAAINLREAVRTLPTFPCSMAIDDATLARVSGLQKDRLSWYKPLGSDLGLSVTMAGNFCFDLIVQDNDGAIFVTPIPASSGTVNPKLIDALMHHEGLLAAIVEIVMDMGAVFNPKPYLSLEDWALDHTREAMDDLSELF